jgi:hypothetical protein
MFVWKSSTSRTGRLSFWAATAAAAANVAGGVILPP